MRVILLSDQRHLGKRGEVVDVKPGFGRNYLVPQGMALEASHANMKYFEQQRGKIDAQHAKERDAAAEIAAKISGLRLEIPKRVGDTGTLYGSVTAGGSISREASSPSANIPSVSSSIPRWSPR